MWLDSSGHELWLGICIGEECKGSKGTFENVIKEIKRGLISAEKWEIWEFKKSK